MSGCKLPSERARSVRTGRKDPLEVSLLVVPGHSFLTPVYAYHRQATRRRLAIAPHVSIGGAPGPLFIRGLG